MPGGMRIPANLLADNILLLEDLSAEEQKLLTGGAPLLVIEDRFTRIEIDNNDNSICLRLYFDEEHSSEFFPANALQPLITCLQQRGVTETALAEKESVETEATETELTNSGVVR